MVRIWLSRRRCLLVDVERELLTMDSRVVSASFTRKFECPIDRE